MTQVIPDYEYVHRELLKDGVTVKQLWEEYVMDCRESGNLYFRYTQFCKKYRDYVDTHRLTMHIRHKPGEKVMVDWAGKTIPFYNPVTGEVSKAYLLVSTLPFSMYCYAEVFPNMKEASCAYIEKSRDIILCGATGSGKTFLANALGMNACRAGYKALYLRLPNFFVGYALAAARNKQQDYTKKLQNVRLLLLDEFLLVPVKPPQQESLLELLERRSGNTSTIYCSQYSFAGWHEQLGGGAIADSILNRIIHGSYKLEIKRDVSMRQRLAEAEKAEDCA